MIESFFIVLSRLLLVYIGFKVYRMCCKWNFLEQPLIGRNGKSFPDAPRPQAGFISVRNPLARLSARARSRRLGGNYKVPWGW